MRKLLLLLCAAVGLLASCTEDLTPEDNVEYAMKERIKAQMKDADSFEEISCDVKSIGDNEYSVTMEFKGTNGYGAVVTQTATATAEWNKESTKIKDFVAF